MITPGASHRRRWQPVANQCAVYKPIVVSVRCWRSRVALQFLCISEGGIGALEDVLTVRLGNYAALYPLHLACS